MTKNVTLHLVSWNSQSSTLFGTGDETSFVRLRVWPDMDSRIRVGCQQLGVGGPFDHRSPLVKSNPPHPPWIQINGVQEHFKTPGKLTYS